MKKELDEELCKKYPNLYRDRNEPPSKSCLHWGFPRDGWFELIDKASAVLEAEILKLPEEQRIDYRASQVKEKFGTLRFYLHNETDAMRAAIRVAESESAKTCEQCGHPGQLDKTRPWMLTLCSQCSSARNSG
jgi:hypothetical protein